MSHMVVFTATKKSKFLFFFFKIIINKLNIKKKLYIYNIIYFNNNK